MSGTPVENSLMDFWTLLSIVQPGLLGTSSDFRSLYQIPIEYRHDMSCAQALKRLTAPFVLRRLKSDPKIIADLPEKTTSDMYVSLLPEQAALYEKLTKQALKKMARLERAQDQKAKRGLILKLLTELKQVCNSPSQWRKRFVQAPDSGKGEVLKELVLRSIADERKVLIFTQYRRMGERLAQWLESIVGHRVPFLHGGVSIKERMHMVDDFQENRHTQVMIVSLKAGGTGLNLTAASVVIHYDLWWNPAVEAQATDRAYRIGQQKNVLVYRLISEGTYEEKLNSLLEHKRAMADATVTRGETWLGDMPLAELEDFLSLQTSVDVS